MKKKQVPTFDQICDWCEENDNHPTEGWLLLLLDGTYSVDELCAAILANRAPESKRTLDAGTDSLIDQVHSLPEYRGWYVTMDDNDDLVEKLVWRHEDYDTKIWLDLIRKDRDQIDLSIDIDDPNDDPYHPRGAYETLPEHTAAAVFAICKPFLDEYGDGDEADSAEVSP
jgi:hypothetical protein